MSGEKRIELNKEYLNIPGLELFGHTVFQKAAEPVPLHIHKNCLEAVFVIRGEQSYFVEGRSYPLTGGQGFLSFESQPHRSGGTCQEVAEIYWLQLDLSDAGGFLGLDRVFSEKLMRRLRSIDKHVFRFGREIKGLLKLTFDRFVGNADSTSAHASLLYLVSLLSEQAGQGQKLENRLRVLESYIDEHLQDSISAEDLSEVSGFSVSTVNHRFKEYFGRTPGEYVNYRRIARAKELLSEGASVTQSAMESGFGSSDYFATVFKKFTGMTPGAWRARAGNENIERNGEEKRNGKKETLK